MSSERVGLNIGKLEMAQAHRVSVPATDSPLVASEPNNAWLSASSGLKSYRWMTLLALLLQLLLHVLQKVDHLRHRPVLRVLLHGREGRAEERENQKALRQGHDSPDS